MSTDQSRLRVSNKLFAAEKRAKFNNAFRKAAVSTARDKRDAETRRMEEYRRLCKKEGIQSSRLAEYDSKKAEANKAIDEALAKIDEDSTLSKAERKRMKFAIKRKAAARETLTDAKGPSHVAMQLERARERQEQEQKQRAEEQASREAAKAESRQKRASLNKLYSQRTSKGQPVMKTRIEALLNRVVQSQQQ